MNAHDKAKAITSMKGGEHRVSALTAYDYPTARILDEAGVDMILVGDSLGMVVLGFPDTTHVTLEMMTHHTAAVARGVTNALIIGDMPINSYETPAQALATAHALVQAGADVVKLEGGIRQLEKIRTIIEGRHPRYRSSRNATTTSFGRGWIQKERQNQGGVCRHSRRRPCSPRSRLFRHRARKHRA